jgi:hypothetical protein
MIHWLRIGDSKLTKQAELKQWENIKDYLEKYPISKTIVYVKNSSDVFAKIVKLECEQSYDELDLDVNSGFNGSIRYLNSRPSDIELCKLQIEHFLSKLN